ncbi:N-formylglutamate amidohydrolase [Polaromonas sp. SM01]|uniref:N-formylglutamate amidohydrolase n=1 Tax=Polaromonas sp. SM01 TaxID=3085630 RepID=UPI002980DB18|nr:N-formylglutamate amidohydrolase [Polaromonas sp. SM01]MDW5444880.1 N-formylglutamate amidohydrolase [Polaromonas sp. SM01]
MTSSLVRSLPGTTALVLDSPHSGTAYPEDFAFACALPMLRRVEDTHVDKLYDFAPALGAGWVEAFFPSSYIDANRDTAEIDVSLFDEAWPEPVATDAKVMAKVRFGKGLIWRLAGGDEPIYQRKLSVAEVQARIATCWVPYHDAVAQAIDTAHARHGYSIHLNCHAMPATAPSQGSEFPGEAHADFVVGTRDGSTASEPLAQLVCAHLTSLGYSVAYHPNKGVELVRRYGEPAEQRHSIQLEVNRKLYMNEETLAMNDGFAPLKTHLQSLVQLLLQTDPRTLAH